MRTALFGQLGWLPTEQQKFPREPLRARKLLFPLFCYLRACIPHLFSTALLKTTDVELDFTSLTPPTNPAICIEYHAHVYTPGFVVAPLLKMHSIVAWPIRSTFNLRLAAAARLIRLQNGTGKLRFWPSLFSAAAQERLFGELSQNPALLVGRTPASKADHARGREKDAAGTWMQRPIILFGKEIPQPRLTCFYGRKGVSYRYHFLIPPDGRPSYSKCGPSGTVVQKGLKSRLEGFQGGRGVGQAVRWCNGCVLVEDTTQTKQSGGCNLVRFLMEHAPRNSDTFEPFICGRGGVGRARRRCSTVDSPSHTVRINYSVQGIPARFNF